MRHLRSFWLDEDGAVTTDWVVLTSGIVFLAVATVWAVRPSIVALGPHISEKIEEQLN